MKTGAVPLTTRSSPSGLFEPWAGKTGPPVTRKLCVVKQPRALSIAAKTARDDAGITSRVSWVHAPACSRSLALSLDRSPTVDGHLNRLPSLSTNTQEPTARAPPELLALALPEQLEEVT
jgi:hypothetical protein